MDGGQVRWWDGSGWTGHVRPRNDAGAPSAGWYSANTCTSGVGNGSFIATRQAQ